MKYSPRFPLTVFLLLIFIISCSKKDDPQPASGSNNTTTSLTIDSPVQATFKAGSNQKSWISDGATITSFFANSSSLSPFPDSSTSKLGAGIENTSSGINTESISFKIGTFKFLIPSDSAAFSQFFAPASIAYSANAENGVRIDYVDENGEMWATDAGSQNQTGSSFVIQETKAFSLFGEKYIRVKAAYHCKLYNLLSGASMDLTDGVCLMIFWADY